MRSVALTVRVAGPLTEFASGFAEELSRLGYTHLSACNLLRLMAHLSRWMASQGPVPAELTRERLLRFLSARRSAGYICRLSERGLPPLVPYLCSCCRCRTGSAAESTLSRRPSKHPSSERVHPLAAIVLELILGWARGVAR